MSTDIRLRHLTPIMTHVAPALTTHEQLGTLVARAFAWERRHRIPGRHERLANRHGTSAWMSRAATKMAHRVAIGRLIDQGHMRPFTVIRRDITQRARLTRGSCLAQAEA